MSDGTTTGATRAPVVAIGSGRRRQRSRTAPPSTAAVPVIDGPISTHGQFVNELEQARSLLNAWAATGRADEDLVWPAHWRLGRCVAWLCKPPRSREL